MATGTAKDIRHQCPRALALRNIDLESFFGPAISDTMHYYPEKGVWGIDNGEYGTAIAFCPYCGLELMTLVIDMRSGAATLREE